MSYFKRLKSHPGISTAYIMMFFGTLAGAANENLKVWWHGALFGFIVMTAFCWGAILITNFKNK